MRDPEAKAIPVSVLAFSSLVRIPGYPGASNTLTTRSTGAWTSNALKVDTILEYKGRFCVDGKFWIPETAGSLLGWEY